MLLVFAFYLSALNAIHFYEVQSQHSLKWLTGKTLTTNRRRNNVQTFVEYAEHAIRNLKRNCCDWRNRFEWDCCNASYYYAYIQYPYLDLIIEYAHYAPEAISYAHIHFAKVTYFHVINTLCFFLFLSILSSKIRDESKTKRHDRMSTEKKISRKLHENTFQIKYSATLFIIIYGRCVSATRQYGMMSCTICSNLFPFHHVITVYLSLLIISLLYMYRSLFLPRNPIESRLNPFSVFFFSSF